MRFLIIFPTIALFLLAGCDFRKTLRPEGDLKYQEVVALPVGLKVIHSPDPGKAMRGGRSGSEFTWLHKTSVASTVGDLTIVEFGAFAHVGGYWRFGTITGKPFTTANFEEWYSCPGGKLVGTNAYADPQNWTGGQSLTRSKSLWYYIAENSAGDRYGGMAIAEHLPELGATVN